MWAMPLVVLCAAWVTAGIFAPPASAHAVLEDSSPRAGQVLASAQAVRDVELRFDEAVGVGLGSVRVIGADGQPVDAGVVYRPGSDRKRVAVRLRDGLANGSYLVLWRVVSADSHPVSGSFSFAIGLPGPVATGVTESGGLAVPVTLGVARFAGLAGVLLLTGAIVFLIACWPAGWNRNRARRLVWGVLIAAGVGSAIELFVQAVYDVGGTMSSLFDVAPLQALLGTRFGYAHVIRLIALLAAAGLIGVLLRPGSSDRTRRLVFAGLLANCCVLIATVAGEGHAAAGDWAGLRMGVDFAHVAAAGTWLGGLAVLALVALPAARKNVVAVPAVGGGEVMSPAMANDDLRGVEVGAQRFSRLALSCVVILVGTGVVQTWHQVGELAALRATHYGQLLIVKVTVLAVILGFAAVSRSAVRARTDAGITTLSRSVAAEAALGVVVVALTAVLVATTPARVAYRPTVERTLHAGPITLQLTAVPHGPRQLDLHLYTFGADGLTAAVVGVHGDADLPSRHLGPIALAPLTGGSGHFIANQVLLPAAGDWTVHLYVRASEFDSYTFTTRLTVR